MYSGSATEKPHRQTRIERRERVLEHHLDIAPQRTELIGRQPRDLATVQLDAAVFDVDQAQQRAAGRRLAAAGFADQAHGLAAHTRSKLTCSTACTRRRTRPRIPPRTGNCVLSPRTRSSGARAPDGGVLDRSLHRCDVRTGFLPAQHEARGRSVPRIAPKVGTAASSAWV